MAKSTSVLSRTMWVIVSPSESLSCQMVTTSTSVRYSSRTSFSQRGCRTSSILRDIRTMHQIEPTNVFRWCKGLASGPKPFVQCAHVLHGKGLQGHPSTLGIARS